MDAIHLPHAITLPTTFGAPGALLQPGLVVQALVLELIQGDVFRLQLPQSVIDVRTAVPLAPGSTITLGVRGAGANARLVIYADDATSAPPPAATNRAPNLAAPNLAAPNLAAPSLAGKHPIGEAVIVARAPAAPPGRAPGEPVIRDAPPIAPARQPDAPPPRTISPPSPQQALGDAVRVAATRQGGLAPLFADVEQIAQAVQAAPDLPAPVRAAARQMLALRVPLEPTLTAADVKQAFVRSGVLFEPRLAAAVRAAPATAPAQPVGQAVDAAGDLKAALIVFREVLKVWSGDTAPVRAMPPALPPAPDHAAPARPALSGAAAIRHLANALAGAPDELLPAAPTLSPEQATMLAKSVASALLARDTPEHAAPPPNGPPLPYRGAPLAAQHPVPPSIALDTPARETAERLIGATEGAIARTTLLQAASLPDQPGAPRSDPAVQRWTFEVPFATPQGTAIAQFEVARDGRGAKGEQQAPVWRARFSLDIEPLGPVHALIALAGARASVTLWAERMTTASRLNENAALLSEALRAAEIEPADFQFRVGAPPVAARQAAPGRFMDRAT